MITILIKEAPPYRKFVSYFWYNELILVARPGRATTSSCEKLIPTFKHLKLTISSTFKCTTGRLQYKPRVNSTNTFMKMSGTESSINQ